MEFEMKIIIEFDEITEFNGKPILDWDDSDWEDIENGISESLQKIFDCPPMFYKEV